MYFLQELYNFTIFVYICQLLPMKKGGAPRLLFAIQFRVVTSGKITAMAAAGQVMVSHPPFVQSSV